MKRRFFVGLALVFSIFLLCAVSSSSEAANLKSSIIGKWVSLDGERTFEFLKDGTVIRAKKPKKDGPFIIGGESFAGILVRLGNCISS